MLDDVDVISSVSGGSFTAAHYALFGTEGFKDFEDNFLYRNIQGELVTRALTRWPRLLRSDVSRIDLAADLYDEVVFKHATFATLLEQAPKPAPLSVAERHRHDAGRALRVHAGPVRPAVLRSLHRAGGPGGGRVLGVSHPPEPAHAAQLLGRAPLRSTSARRAGSRTGSAPSISHAA